MAFILSQKDTLTLDVTVVLKEGTDKFKAEFKRPTQADVEKIFDADDAMSNKALLDAYWVSFSGLEHEGQQVEYNESTRAAVLNVPEANTALASTFTKFLMESLGKNNKIGIRQKN